MTPDAQSVVQEAGQYATGDQVSTHVTVVGHTDTSGGFAYNMRLSERRAKAKRKPTGRRTEIAQSELDVSWKGFTEPAVQTGPGVKEPLNRRAVIDVDF